MERKKMLIVIFALVVLLGSVVFAARRIADKDRNNNPKSTQNNTKNDVTPGQGTKADSDTANIMGTIKKIEGKSLTIGVMENLTVVNIDGSTPVRIVEGKNPIVTGQVADLKVGDAVSVTFGKTTKNATVIFITRNQTMEKAK